MKTSNSINRVMTNPFVYLEYIVCRLIYILKVILSACYVFTANRCTDFNDILYRDILILQKGVIKATLIAITDTHAGGDAGKYI